MIILSNFKRIAQNCQGQIDGASANFRLCADEPAAGVAELAVVGDDVPVLIRAEHRHGGAVRNFSDDGPVTAGVLRRLTGPPEAVCAVPGRAGPG